MLYQISFTIFHNATVVYYPPKDNAHAGVGNENFHIDTAREVENYFQLTYGGNMSKLLKPGSSNAQVLLSLGSTDGNIRYASGYLRELADERTGFKWRHMYEDLTDDDKLIIYGAYRAGIGTGLCYSSLIAFQSAAQTCPSGRLMSPSLNNYRGYYP